MSLSLCDTFKSLTTNFPDSTSLIKSADFPKYIVLKTSLSFEFFKSISKRIATIAVAIIVTSNFLYSSNR